MKHTVVCNSAEVKSEMPTVEEVFGDRLRQLRTERGLSQERLAELAQLHRNYIGHLERGEKTASLQVLLKLSMALDIPVADLLVDFTPRRVRALVS